MIINPLKSRFRSSSGKTLVVPWLFVVTLIIGFLFAYYLGRLSGGGDVKKIVGILTVIAIVVVCLILKSKIWLLVPATWYLTGALGGIPLPFSLNELCVMFVFAMFMAFYALKIPLYKPTYGKLDLVLFINLIYLATVFVRNPVGVEVLGADRVGGRPYFTVLTSLLAYWVFRHVLLDARLVKTFPILLGVGSAMTALLGVVTRYVPGTATLIAPFYTGVNVQSLVQENFNVAEQNLERDIGRWTEVGHLGSFLNSYLCAMYRPVTLLIPVRVFHWLLFMVSWAAILMSGFRSLIISNGVIFLLAAYFYGGMRDVLRSAFAALAILIFVLAGQGNIFELPGPAQRALSFLPAAWTSQLALDDAQQSANWRYGIWKRVWSSDRYIHDKIWGDGFGFTAADYQIQLSAMLGGPGYMDADEGETQAITGAYHSGPLSAIRVVGIVGLLLYTLLMIMAANLAWGLISKARSTPFFGLTLFVGLPIIYKPFDYWLIFGGFDSSFPATIFQIGLLRLVSDSLMNSQNIVPEVDRQRSSSVIQGKRTAIPRRPPLASHREN